MAWLLALALAAGGCGGGGERPNVVLVTVDALRADILDAYGGRGRLPVRTMPNVDALMAKSVVLRSCYTTLPRVTPAVASILTGLYPTNHGAYGLFHRLDGGVETLADRLYARGYRTMAVVANGFLQNGRGFEQGFELYDDFLVHQPGQFAEFLVDRVDLHTLNGLEEPFFLWLHFADPGWPYDPPAQIIQEYHREYRKPFTLHADIDSGLVTRGEIIFEHSLDSLETRHLQRRYLAEVSYVDGHVGRLMGILETRGLLEDTIVAFASDHGESIGEHGYYYAHGEYLYEPTVRVPACIRYGDNLEPGPFRGLASLVDLLPTILDLAGIEVPAGLDGMSLAPAMRTDDLSPRRSAFMESDYHLVHAENPKHFLDGPAGKSRAIVAERHKLIRVPMQKGSILELYDLEADPLELRNIAGEKPATTERLAYQLATLDSMIARQIAVPEPPRLPRGAERAE